MENSILETIKKLLGIDTECKDFDIDVIVNINTVISALTQMGVGPEEGFSITGSDETWNDFIEELHGFEMIKTYIYLKVKNIFDPPQQQSLIGSSERIISEIEYRIRIQVENAQP